jgi:hypothetical protein
MKETLTNDHLGKPVKVKGLKGEIIFECTGPGKGDCSVLILNEPGKPKTRKYVKLADVELVSEENT